MWLSVFASLRLCLPASVFFFFSLCILMWHCFLVFYTHGWGLMWTTAHFFSTTFSFSFFFTVHFPCVCLGVLVHLSILACVFLSLCLFLVCASLCATVSLSLSPAFRSHMDGCPLLFASVIKLQGVAPRVADTGMEPCFPHMGMEPCFPHMGMEPGFPHMGMEPCFPHTGMEPCFPHMGMEPCFPHMGMEPCFPRTGKEPCFPHMGMGPCFPHTGMEPCFPHTGMEPCFPQSNETNDCSIGTLVATLPGAGHYRVSTRTGWPCVNKSWLGETANLACNFHLSVAACTAVQADQSMRYSRMLLEG